MTPLPSAETWPTSVDDAVRIVVLQLGPDWKSRIRATTRTKAQSFHFTLGRWIRNSFGLWRGNVELLADCARRLHELDESNDVSCHLPIDGDLASSVILGAVWDHLAGEPSNESDRMPQSSSGASKRTE